MSSKELSPNKKLAIVFGVFLAAYFIPFEAPRILGATNEAFLMLGEYARQHVLLCLVPAMFIAGAIPSSSTSRLSCATWGRTPTDSSPMA